MFRKGVDIKLDSQIISELESASEPIIIVAAMLGCDLMENW